jgi:hypothetical protein
VVVSAHTGHTKLVEWWVVGEVVVELWVFGEPAEQLECCELKANQPILVVVPAQTEGHTNLQPFPDGEQVVLELPFHGERVVWELPFHGEQVVLELVIDVLLQPFFSTRFFRRHIFVRRIFMRKK